MPELKASPRNRALGLLADVLSGAKSAADTVQLPVVGGLGSLLFGDAPELVNDVAYYGPQALVRGGNAATGGLGTFAPDRRVLDAIGVAPMAPGAVRAAKTVANPMTYGRAFMEAQAPAVISPITAWHGSPHKFRKFDNSKMGTGEGAQAYGAGAYLADAKGVAEEYKRGLGGLEMRDKSGNVIPIPEELNWVAKDLAAAGGDYKKVKDALIEHGKNYPWPAEVGTRYINDLEKIGAKPNELGYLYKADIPDEAVANMLLWDKPLSEQPHVMDLINKQESARTQAVLDQRLQTLANLGNDAPNARNLKRQIEILREELANPQGSGLGSLTGGEYYNYLRRRGVPPEEQANMFKNAGIPGIRYLDAGSRGQGAGTMNTVVFDDSIIKILERNGVPLGLLAD